jgi:hypothetical protein
LEELTNILLEKYDNNMNIVNTELSHKVVNDIISDLSNKDFFLKKKSVTTKTKNLVNFTEEKGAKRYIRKFFVKNEIFRFKGKKFQQKYFLFLKTAKILNGVITLSCSNRISRGAVWFHQKLALQNSFSTHFKFRINEKGGEGFAFVLHNDPFSSNAIGRKGNSLGYGGLKNCLAIEFDTNKNVLLKDENDNHIAIMTGDHSKCYSNHQISEIKCFSSLDFKINDGNDHYVQIYYDGENSILDLFVDGKFLFSCGVNLRSVFEDECWVGFTAVGNKNHAHIISQWKLFTYNNKELNESDVSIEKIENSLTFENNFKENDSNFSDEKVFNPFIEISYLEKEIEKKLNETNDFIEKEILFASLQNLEKILLSLHKMGTIIYFKDPLIKNFLISHPIWFNDRKFLFYFYFIFFI